MKIYAWQRSFEDHLQLLVLIDVICAEFTWYARSYVSNANQCGIKKTILKLKKVSAFL